MAYHPLEISSTTPKKVQDFIRRHVDMLFEDVHCMMRLPIPAQELRAGCNFAAATFLLDLISGISRSLYSGPGSSGVRFKAVLEKYYPWDMEPVGGFDARTGSKVLYDIFRNPLVHALGLSRERMAVGKSGLPEDLLESLERSVVRPKVGPAEATIMAYPADKRMDLLVEGLYWGVRHMVCRLTNDLRAYDRSCQATSVDMRDTAENAILSIDHGVPSKQRVCRHFDFSPLDRHREKPILNIR